jgi:hypothetical protein
MVAWQWIINRKDIVGKKIVEYTEITNNIRLEKLRKTTENASQDSRRPAEIQIWHLQNTSQKRFSLS